MGLYLTIRKYLWECLSISIAIVNVTRGNLLFLYKLFIIWSLNLTNPVKKRCQRLELFFKLWYGSQMCNITYWKTNTILQIKLTTTQFSFGTLFILHLLDFYVLISRTSTFSPFFNDCKELNLTWSWRQRYRGLLEIFINKIYLLNKLNTSNLVCVKCTDFTIVRMSSLKRNYI